MSHEQEKTPELTSFEKGIRIATGHGISEGVAYEAVGFAFEAGGIIYSPGAIKAVAEAEIANVPTGEIIRDVYSAVVNTISEGGTIVGRQSLDNLRRRISGPERPQRVK